MRDADYLLKLIEAHGPARGGVRQAVINPATEEVLASVATCDAADVEQAVARATAAAAQARRTPIAERRRLLVTLAERLDAQADAMATLLTLEQGKPRDQALREIQGAAGLFRYYAGLHADRGDRPFDEEAGNHRRLFTPLGVVAGIIPWNFPFLIAAMKIAPAILTGNAIIAKPAPTSPLTTLALAALAADDLPEGLLQVLADGGAVGPMLVEHPAIAKIAFTGSTATGQGVMRSAAASLKRLTLELGGNDAALILEDADPEIAAAGIFKAAFTNAGQICGAAKRVYVHEKLFDAFAAALARQIDAVVVGDGRDPGTTLGPVQNDRQYRRAMELMAAAEASGQIVARKAAPQGKGYFVPPTAFADLADDHVLVAEEQFAPMLPLLRFSSEDEAIARANASEYGLTASVWSNDRERAESVVAQLDAALLCINRHNECTPDIGLNMTKQSGLGWLLGDEGVKEYMQAHALVR
jgi:acyl-CoA reductase-like NAD-dependent aldehyde dehydrogenase